MTMIANEITAFWARNLPVINQIKSKANEMRDHGLQIRLISQTINKSRRSYDPRIPRLFRWGYHRAWGIGRLAVHREELFKQSSTPRVYLEGSGRITKYAWSPCEPCNYPQLFPL